MYGCRCIFVKGNGMANVNEDGVYADLVFSWNASEIHSIQPIAYVTNKLTTRSVPEESHIFYHGRKPQRRTPSKYHRTDPKKKTYK